MIEAKGTREEIFELGMEIGKEYYSDQSLDNIEGVAEATLRVFERRGFITKPEWEKAYDDYHKANTIQPYALKVMDIMRDHIVELEKIVMNGK